MNDVYLAAFLAALATVALGWAAWVGRGDPYRLRAAVGGTLLALTLALALFTLADGLRRVGDALSSFGRATQEEAVPTTSSRPYDMSLLDGECHADVTDPDC